MYLYHVLFFWNCLCHDMTQFIGDNSLIYKTRLQDDITLSNLYILLLIFQTNASLVAMGVSITFDKIISF